MKSLRFLALGLLLPHCPQAADQGRSAIAVLDAYLAGEAPSTPEYRADLQPGGDPARVPAGRLLGLGPIAGPFTYRPKTYAELSRSQRAALLREPRFRRFVAQFASGRGGAPAARWTVAPEEMLSRRPCLLTLPPP